MVKLVAITTNGLNEEDPQRHSDSEAKQGTIGLTEAACRAPLWSDTSEAACTTIQHDHQMVRTKPVDNGGCGSLEVKRSVAGHVELLEEHVVHPLDQRPRKVQRVLPLIAACIDRISQAQERRGTAAPQEDQRERVFAELSLLPARERGQQGNEHAK